ncbi:3949_t:CDS:2, partial [Funneliformis geosporum]
ASVMVMLISEDTRYEKWELMNSLLAFLLGFVDLDWKFLNDNTYIIFHYNNRKLLLEVIDKALEQCVYIDILINELKLQNQFVANFKEFKEYTIASEAIRTM